MALGATRRHIAASRNDDTVNVTVRELSYRVASEHVCCPVQRREVQNTTRSSPRAGELPQKRLKAASGEVACALRADSAPAPVRVGRLRDFPRCPPPSASSRRALPAAAPGSGIPPERVLVPRLAAPTARAGPRAPVAAERVDALLGGCAAPPPGAQGGSPFADKEPTEQIRSYGWRAPRGS